MHFSVNVSLGDIAAIIVCVGAIFRFEQFRASVQTFAERLLFEHEIVLQDYCERKGVKLADLPTRSRPKF